MLLSNWAYDSPFRQAHQALCFSKEPIFDCHLSFQGADPKNKTLLERNSRRKENNRRNKISMITGAGKLKAIRIRLSGPQAKGSDTPFIPSQALSSESTPISRRHHLPLKALSHCPPSPSFHHRSPSESHLPSFPTTKRRFSSTFACTILQPVHLPAGPINQSESYYILLIMQLPISSNHRLASC